MAVPALLLRRYRPSDFQTLYRIDHACFPPGIAYGQDELKGYLAAAGAECIVAELAGEIAGFTITDRAGDTGHIITIDVLKAHRRRKIGSILLRAAEQSAAAAGVRRMCLETATNNKPAIAFWKRHGYRQFGVIENYYGRGSDALEMDKTLKAPPAEPHARESH